MHNEVIDPKSLPHPVKSLREWIPLKDGTRLAARIWIPESADQQPVPALMEYLPYCLRYGTVLRDSKTHPYIAGHGYACIRIDLRGTGDSEGVILDEYLRQEQEDALEVLSWIAVQPWCTGSIGMMGISWGGFNSLQVAALRHPNLKMIVTLCSTDNRYEDDIHYKDGILLAENPGWGATAAAYMSRPADPAIVTENWEEHWKKRLEAGRPWIHTWMDHPLKDEYWEHGSVAETPDAIQIPTLLVGGWDDSYASAMVRMIKSINTFKRCIIGPWAHKYPHFAVPGPQIGMLQVIIRWLDQYCKGIDQKIEQDPLIRFYLLDSFRPKSEYEYKTGFWCSAESWPPQDTQDLSYNFSTNPQTSISSPANTGRNGGEFCVIWLGPEWPTDQRADDKLSHYIDIDIEEDFNLVGAPRLELRFQADQPEAHIFVRLCDVAPDGSSTRITYGAMNLSHRETHKHAYAITPGVWHKNRVILNDIAYQIPKGHKLRVALSTTYWPMFIPTAKPVKLKIDPMQTRIILPKAPDKLTAAPPFEQAEGTPDVNLEVIKPSSHQRYYLQDDQEKTFEHMIKDDFGQVKHLEHGLITGEYAFETHKRAQDGKNSSLNIRWLELVERQPYKAETEYRLRFIANEQGYDLTSELSAKLNDRPFFNQTWQTHHNRPVLFDEHHPKVRAFIDLVEKTCKENGIRYHASPTETVIMYYGDTRTEVSGYFLDQSSVGPILAYAKGRPFYEWFTVLLHEFHHMEQYIQKFPTMMTINQYANIWKWLNHEIEMSQEQVIREIHENRLLELDTEKRSQAAILKYELPIDPKLYAKEANAYLFGYQYTQTHRVWLSGEQAPYLNPAITSVMPDHFDHDYDTINQEFLRLYESQYLNPSQDRELEAKTSKKFFEKI